LEYKSRQKGHLGQIADYNPLEMDTKDEDLRK